MKAAQLGLTLDSTISLIPQTMLLVSSNSHLHVMSHATSVLHNGDLPIFPQRAILPTAQKKYNPRPYFHSRRIRKGTIDRPELREKDARVIWATLIPAFGFVAGFGIIAVLTWSGYSSVSRHKYCEVFTDDFSSGFNSTIWTKHVETGGYG